MEVAEICAVVVAYHADDAVLQNLRLLRDQVESVIVVDNGSFEVELIPLRSAVEALGLQLIENEANLGIATALNQGVREAARRGFRWVLLFDQDSRVTEGFVPAMKRCFAANSDDGRLAILNPRYRDSRSGEWIPSCRPVPGGVEQATTSGSLMPMNIFEAVGWFADELFIDGVDYDYSLRVRRLGYRIVECQDAELIHSPGAVTVHRFGWRHIHVANYSPVRRFYQERNKVLLLKRHGRRFPEFFANVFFISLKDAVKVLLAESHKWTKLRSMLRGHLHGLLGSTGKFPG